ncbi:hypothetical protein OAH51_01655 [Verrucomicrobia bacterium]|nr:hypothetical protein [Verrucomicrobiota bacterium]
MGRAHHVAKRRLDELALAQPGQKSRQQGHPLDGGADLRPRLTVPLGQANPWLPGTIAAPQVGNRQPKFLNDAGVVELVDTGDLNPSCLPIPPHRHH